MTPFAHTPAPTNATATVDGVDLRVGDVLDFLGTPIRIDRLEPYPADSPIASILGPGARVAYGPGRFAITVPARLPPFVVYLPRPPAPAPAPVPAPVV